MPDITQLHATCIALGGKGVLLLGESGSGKSDLALRLIDIGATLVADDRVDIIKPSPLEGEGRVGGGAAENKISSSPSLTTPHPNLPPQGGKELLIASAPLSLRGKIEARGIGILTLPFQEKIPLTLAIQLVPREQVERLPEAQFWGCHGVQLPLLSLYAFDHSTPAKIRLYLHGE